MLGRQNVGVEGLKYVEFGVTRINRYIVECKFIIEKRPAFPQKGINRYIVECKLSIRSSINKSYSELIDT